MNHIIKNNKWVLTSSLVCILFGLLTFFTFINQSFKGISDLNLQILLIIDFALLGVFFTLIIIKTFKIFKNRRNKKIGSETSLKYLILFSSTTLLPSILIALFSLILFNVGLQKYFDKKIKLIVNNSAEVASNYVKQTRNSIESDVVLMVLDVNSKSALYYDNPKKFLNVLSSQRLLRRLDEVYLLDSSGNIIMSSIMDSSLDYVPPPDEAFVKSLNGRPVRITDPYTNRTSSLVKLNNFIDTYLYIVRFMDPKVINYLKQASEAVSFYFSVQDRRTGIKISFAIIYLLIVSLLLFLSVIISINLASSLTLPIINLIGASEKISAGELDTKVPIIETDNEFKKLNENFNLMIEKLKMQQNKLLMNERHEAWESVARKLAHEIKNPLTPIQLSIDRIKEKYLKNAEGDNKSLDKYLNTITNQIQDIEYLLNEFSDFARMPKPILKKIDLNKIILRSVNLHELSDPEIKFNFSKKTTAFFILADEEQLNRVVLNLIKNSIESIQDKKRKNVDFKGKINIEIKDDNDYIYVIIVDNGIGFDQVDKQKMITPYFTTKIKGTGLGLSIVTKIISDHNGLSKFDSINEGAKVEIALPKYYE